MLKDSHTSVLGMRECRNYEQRIVTDFESLRNYLDKNPPVKKTNSRCLFAMTAMSNFCGRKYNLEIIDQLKRGFISFKF
jgi:phosphorylcholine metabolism protein LicD